MRMARMNGVPQLVASLSVLMIAAASAQEGAGQTPRERIRERIEGQVEKCDGSGNDEDSGSAKDEPAPPERKFN